MSAVKKVDMVWIDKAAELWDDRSMMIRRHKDYSPKKPRLQIRLADKIFVELNAHELYDALFELIRGSSVEGICIVKGDIANYNSKELFDMAELAKLAEAQEEDLGPVKIKVKGHDYEKADN